ncbi:hypothetical protein HMPREF1345_02066, partial [Enterococcus faecium TX1337RF]
GSIQISIALKHIDDCKLLGKGFGSIQISIALKLKVQIEDTNQVLEAFKSA